MSSSISEEDVAEISRLAEKKSIMNISKALLEHLDRETLSRMMSSYLVLKAHGHPDKDFVNYLTTKETGKTFKLGFAAARAFLPAMLTDGELRDLVMSTRKQMNKEKEEKEYDERLPEKRTRVAQASTAS